MRYTIINANQPHTGGRHALSNLPTALSDLSNAIERKMTLKYANLKIGLSTRGGAAETSEECGALHGIPADSLSNILPLCFLGKCLSAVIEHGPYGPALGSFSRHSPDRKRRID